MNVIAYWLLPKGRARDFFTETIRGLATRFDAPVFHPHLTLSIVPEASRLPAEVIAGVGKPGLTLSVARVRSSKLFTKTLFVQFNHTNALQQLSDKINKIAGARERSILDPHLSLLYRDLPDQTKRKLARSIQIPFREVTFDSLCAVRCASPTQTADDVRAWQLLATIPRLRPG